MTCIVGMEIDGRVYIGGDSCAADVSQYTYQEIINPKVFKRNDMIFGYTHTFRFGQLIEYFLKIPKHDKCDTDMEYLITKLIPAIRECLNDNGAGNKKDEIESGGCCLVGYKGILYTLQNDYSILRSASGFAAVGCGDLPALAAMTMVMTHIGMNGLGTAPQVLNAVLETTASVISYVKPPFKIMSI